MPLDHQLQLQVEVKIEGLGIVLCLEQAFYQALDF